VGLPLAPYCSDHPCPRDYDDAVARAFAGEPTRQVYPACRGARAVAVVTSDTADAWFFDGVTGALIGEESSDWGKNTRYGRVVSRMDCKPEVEPKHFTWRTDAHLTNACEALGASAPLPAGAPDTFRFRKDDTRPGNRSPVYACVVATTDGHFVTGDGHRFRVLSLPEWSGLLRALEDAHLDRTPPASPPPPETDDPPGTATTEWQIDTVVAGTRTTAVRHGATLDHHFHSAVRAFSRLVAP
jgi:hypothetical protein